jgi:DNA adenine methylase
MSLHTPTSFKPFLKWAGGKARLLHELVPRLPETFHSYHEPFIGGGALYFHLAPKSFSFISDINSELINVYQTIQNQVDLLIEELTNYQNNPDYYKSIRELDRDVKVFSKLTSIQRAARFIFLNKTCFNGLYRVNSKGQFNVPFGYYKSPKILDTENLINCSVILKNANISCTDYRFVINSALAEDFVYFVPPYIPDGISSSFTQYTKDGFGMKEQEDLLDLCRGLHNNGVKWMLSNSSAPIVYKMYEKFNIDTVHVSRSIGCTPTSRKKVNEVIIRNY